jgi:hypothetical protein
LNFWGQNYFSPKIQIGVLFKSRILAQLLSRVRQ